jgi:hypothetical protein
MEKFVSHHNEDGSLKKTTIKINDKKDCTKLPKYKKKKALMPLVTDQIRVVEYQNKKCLTKEEQLEYENMKLRIENELLKKGFLMKGDGTIVKFMK